MGRGARIPLEQLWPRTGPDTPQSGLDPDTAVGGPGSAEHAILRAGIELFGRLGYGGTSTRALASAASVTAPLIGYHFGSKEGLFRACTDVVIGGLTARTLEICARDGGLEETVKRFAALHIHAGQSYPHAVRFALSVVYGPEEGQPEVDVFAHWLPVMTALTDRLRRAIDAQEFSPRPGATLPGLVQQLIHAVHLEVFGAYERERFGKQSAGMMEVAPPVTDPVGEVVAQYFHGAGTLARRSGSLEEDPR